MRIIKVIGIGLVSVGLSLNIYNKINIRESIIRERNKIESTLKKEINYRYVDNSYSAILSIPKINLKKGIYSIDDKRNNIEENIMMHKDFTSKESMDTYKIRINENNMKTLDYFNLKFIGLVQNGYVKVKYA